MFRRLGEGIHRIAKAETISDLAYDTMSFFPVLRRLVSVYSLWVEHTGAPAPLENSTFNTSVSSSRVTYPSSIGEFASLTASPFNATTVLVPGPQPKAPSAKSGLVDRYLVE